VRPNPIGKVCRQFQRRWIPTASRFAGLHQRADPEDAPTGPPVGDHKHVVTMPPTSLCRIFVVFNTGETRGEPGLDLRVLGLDQPDLLLQSVETGAKGQRCYTAWAPGRSHGAQHRLLPTVKPQPCGELYRLDTRSYHSQLFRELVDVGSYAF
jgi:hypothetical protein